MDGYDKALVIEALSQVSADRLSDTFVNHVNQLIPGEYGNYKAFAAEALSQVPVDRLNDTFVNYVNQLTPYNSDKREIIKALSQTPVNRLNDIFVNYAKKLSFGCNTDEAKIIEVLSQGPADRLNDTFVTTVNQFMPNSNNCRYKHLVVDALLQVPAEEFTGRVARAHTIHFYPWDKDGIDRLVLIFKTPLDQEVS
ncbi:hypothetical protein IPF37_04300 [bacterium]|nr:MAG: hypothetical protein IPF37_04300 [bacterium]